MKYALPLPFLLVITACNFRIYINGEFSHKVKGSITRWGSYDSCFVLEQNDSVPPGAVYISDTRLVTPGFWNIVAPVETLLNLAKDEARKQGANIIRTTCVEGSRRVIWNTKFYRIEGLALSNYHRDLDSIAAINRHYAIIHIWNYTFPYPSSPNIYFNDSLVGTSQAPTRDKPGHGFEIQELDLRFSTEGTLSLTRQRTPRSSRHLEVGKVYTMVVLPPREGFYFLP